MPSPKKYLMVWRSKDDGLSKDSVPSHLHIRATSRRQAIQMFRQTHDPKDTIVDLLDLAQLRFMHQDLLRCEHFWPALDCKRLGDTHL